MSIVDNRLVRIGFVVLVALGLVAVTCIDVAVADRRRAHDRRVAAQRALHRAETRYLNGVSQISAQLFDIVQPYQQVIDDLNRDPTAILSARDAFAVASPPKQINALVARLDALPVPSTMRSHQSKLHAAL